MALPEAAPRVFKADADAQSAWVVEIEKKGASLRVNGRLVRLDQRRSPDRSVVQLAYGWLKKHDELFCSNDCKGLDGAKLQACLMLVKDGACLKESYAQAASMIETEELANRSKETGFGDWVADQMRVAGAADVGFINSGSIRINQNLPEGTLLTRRHLEQMFPFRGKLVIRDVPGRDLWRAMEFSIAHRGEGDWVHFSGLAVQLGANDKLERVLVRRGENGVVEIGPQSDVPVKVASIAFVLSGHGFDLCAGKVPFECAKGLDAATRWPSTGTSADNITDLVRESLRKVPVRRGLVLPVDRRLCEPGQTDCQTAKWLK